jgi:Fe-S-cluster containining protein
MAYDEGAPAEALQEEFLCVRCARHRKTCCQLSEVYVTLGDVKRIADHAGCDDFHDHLAPTNPVYEPDGDDPTWRDYVFRPDGTRRVLRRQANGNCTFLAANGCTLPLDVRPLLCRIYPYDFNDRGLLDALAPGCPLELLRPGQGLIEALAMNRADAEAWHEQLYEEILWEKDDAASKSDLAIAATAAGERGA